MLDTVNRNSMNLSSHDADIVCIRLPVLILWLFQALPAPYIYHVYSGHGRLVLTHQPYFQAA